MRGRPADDRREELANSKLGRRNKASRTRWNEICFNPMSYVMFSTNTCAIEARQINAPKIVVRGISSRMPPSISTHPVKIS
jgi:hypothetical protein